MFRGRERKGVSEKEESLLVLMRSLLVYTFAAHSSEESVQLMERDSNLNDDDEGKGREESHHGRMSSSVKSRGGNGSVFERGEERKRERKRLMAHPFHHSSPLSPLIPYRGSCKQKNLEPSMS